MSVSFKGLKPDSRPGAAGRRALPVLGLGCYVDRDKAAAPAAANQVPSVRVNHVVTLRTSWAPDALWSPLPSSPGVTLGVGGFREAEGQGWAHGGGATGEALVDQVETEESVLRVRFPHEGDSSGQTGRPLRILTVFWLRKAGHTTPRAASGATVGTLSWGWARGSQRRPPALQRTRRGPSQRAWGIRAGSEHAPLTPCTGSFTAETEGPSLSHRGGLRHDDEGPLPTRRSEPDEQSRLIAPSPGPGRP